MSDMTVSRDSTSPVDPTLSKVSTTSQVQVEQSTSPTKDSLATAAISAQESVTSDINAPKLASPNFYQALLDASSDLDYQLFVSNIVSQQTRVRVTGIASSQAQKVARLLEQRSTEMQAAKAEARNTRKALEQQLEEMEKQLDKQRDLIDDVNDGNGDEQDAYQELAEARTEYLEELKELGIVDKGNEQFAVPEEAKKEFNELTKKYQEAVGDFNDYWKDRSKELEDYNSKATEYNQKVKEYNQFVTDLINKYNLKNYLEDNDMSVPLLKEADLRDLSIYADTVDAPSKIETAPSDVTIPKLPYYIKGIADKGPPVLTELDSEDFDIDADDVYKEIYNNLYTKNIQSLDQELSSQTMYWAFLKAMERSRVLNDQTPDPLLNDKILVRAFEKFRKPQSPASEAVEENSILQPLELDNEQLKRLLMESALKRILQDKLHLPEQQTQRVVEQFIVLAVGLLSNTGMQALFPSLSLLKENNLLATLPKDSPAFALLFATSFANRIQEETQQGLVGQALEIFLEATPELANLSPANKAELETSLNISLLFVATKMMEVNLGLPGLSIHLLAPLLPIDTATLLTELQQEKKQETVKLTQQMETQFLSQGYAPEEAHFLAQVSVELEPVLSAPQVPTVSASSIQPPLLTRSLTAALVLDHYPLKEATEISQQAIQSTLNAGPYSSSNLFRTALDTHLQDLGMPAQKAQEMASQVLLISPFDNSLAASLFSSPIESTKPIPGTIHASPTERSGTVAPSNSLLLPTETLKTIVENRVLTLLTPQVGAVVARKISEEVSNTLFGQPNPDAADKAGAKFIYSLQNVTRHQLYHGDIELNRVRSDELAIAGKEMFKYTYDSNALLQRLMDPAYRLLYSSRISGIKEDTNWKNPMSIMV